MKTRLLLKMLALAALAALPLQLVSAKSDDAASQVSPHAVYAGLGPSFVPGVYVNDAYMSMGSIKRGIGFTAGYEYSVPTSHWSFGVNYVFHQSGGVAKYYPEPTTVSLPIDFYVHNITPVAGGHWEWGKHAFRFSGGVGYMYSIAVAELRLSGVGVLEEDEEEDGVSLYLSLEYEYRFSPKMGLFVRAYDMECYDEYDGTEGEWEGIVGYGVSAGFKWHF